MYEVPTVCRQIDPYYLQGMPQRSWRPLGVRLSDEQGRNIYSKVKSLQADAAKNYPLEKPDKWTWKQEFRDDPRLDLTFRKAHIANRMK